MSGLWELEKNGMRPMYGKSMLRDGHDNAPQARKQISENKVSLQVSSLYFQNNAIGLKITQ